MEYSNNFYDGLSGGMEDKYIVVPRADGKSTLQLARTLGAICSIVWTSQRFTYRRLL